MNCGTRRSNKAGSPGPSQLPPQAKSMNIIQFGPNTYVARLEKLTVSGLDIKISGTLDGYIDFAVTPVDQKSRTYSLTCDDARRIMAALGSVVADVQGNCLFERDGLLRDSMLGWL